MTMKSISTSGGLNKSKLDVQFVKSATRYNMLKGKFKEKHWNWYLDISFYIYLGRVTSGCTFHNLLTGVTPV